MKQNSLSSLLERAKGASKEEIQRELLKIVQLGRELKRTNPLSFYRPNPKQLLFHQSRKKKRWFVAANGAGKSNAGVVEDSWWALGEHPWQPVPMSSDGWVVCQTYQAQIQPGGIQEKFQKYFPRHRIAKIMKREAAAWGRLIVTCLKCGKGGTEEDEPKCKECGRRLSTVSFKTYDQKLDVFAGATLDWVHFDEEPPEHIRDECLIRLRKATGGWEWGTMTPVKGLSWTQPKIGQPFLDYQQAGREHPEIDVITASMYDNMPHITQEYIDRVITDCGGDKTKIRIRVFGEWTVLSGQVFPGWDPDKNEVEDVPRNFLDAEGKLHPDLDVYVGIDTGYFFAAIFFFADYMGNLWLFDEFHAEKMPIARVAPELKRKFAYWGITNPTCIIDKASSDDIELAEYGVYCTKALPLTREEGNEVVANYMAARGLEGGHQMLIACRKRCPQWLRQLAVYQHAPPAKTGPNAGAQKADVVKKDDHGMDAGRFVMTSRPHASRPHPGRDSRTLHARTLDKVKKEIKDSREPSDEDIYRDL